VPGLLEMQRITPSREGELARGVGAAVGSRYAGGGAGDVDDRDTAAAGPRGGSEQREQRLGQLHRRLEVELHVALHIVPARIPEGAPPGGARIVDQQVEAPVLALEDLPDLLRS